MFFPRRGPYAGAVIRFTLTFAPPLSSPTPEIDLQTRVFHPLVDSVTGRVHLLSAPPPGFPTTRATAFWPFPPPSPTPSSDTSGEDCPTISRLLEEFRTVFESEAALDAILEGYAVDAEAWWSLHGHRGGTDGWDERVAWLVRASQDDVRSGRGDKDVFLLRGDLDDLADGHEGGRPALEKLKRSVLEELRERGR